MATFRKRGPYQWQAQVRKKGQSLQTKTLRFHDLRYEATTRPFEKGLNIMGVASITGHKDLRMLRRYAHLKKAEDLAIKLG